MIPPTILDSLYASRSLLPTRMPPANSRTCRSRVHNYSTLIVIVSACCRDTARRGVSADPLSGLPVHAVLAALVAHGSVVVSIATLGAALGLEGINDLRALGEFPCGIAETAARRV